MSQHILLNDLARELGINKSNARKYMAQQGITFYKVRVLEAGNQLMSALSKHDADKFRSYRERQGFGSKNPIPEMTDDGYFYIVQAAPELDPNRIKLGFAADPNVRLLNYKTICPTACIVKTWPCKQVWEKAAIASTTRIECEQIGQEMYTCTNLQTLCERATAFFRLMPSG